MKRRTPLILFAAVLALLGTAGVLLYAKSADSRALAGKEAVTVLVTTQRIPAGTSASRIRAEDYVEKVQMPAETVPPDALGEIDKQLDQLVLTGDVQPRQLLMRGMFGDASTLSDGLAIPEGKVAVSVGAHAQAQVAGYVRPGSKIAIFNTFTVMEGKGRVPAGDDLNREHDYNHATRVLLSRVEVIGVGANGAGGVTSAQTSSAKKETDSSASQPQNGDATVLVTVAVTQPEAERLVHAAQTGRLYFALLTDSSDLEPGPGVDNRSLFN